LTRRRRRRPGPLADAAELLGRRQRLHERAGTGELAGLQAELAALEERAAAHPPLDEEALRALLAGLRGQVLRLHGGERAATAALGAVAAPGSG
jgi:hypothetical protein